MASIHASVVATAAKFEFSSAMRVLWTSSADAFPAAFARWMAPVASEMISTPKPSSSAPAADARSQLLVTKPTSVIVSTS